MGRRATPATAARGPSRKRQVLPPDVRVDSLMAAAADLFVDRGIEATTVSDIVARAEVAKGTFYHYFSSKDDVVLALRDRFTQDFVTTVGAAIDACAPDDHPGRLAAWLRTTIAVYFARYTLHDVVFHAFRPEHRRQSRDKDKVVAQLCDLLQAGQAAGAWSVPDLRTTALVLYEGMHAAVDDAIACGTRDADAIDARLSVLFGRMLSPP